MSYSKGLLGLDQVKSFNENGYCIIDDLISADQRDSITKKINLLASQVLTKNFNVTSECLNPYLELARINRADAGKVFDALIKIPEVNRVAYNQKLQIVAEQLLNSSLVLSPPLQMNIRSDHPLEENFLYPWHTDYAYNFSSKNSLIFWIPLLDVDELNGALHLVPGSHKEKMMIEIDDAAVMKKKSSQYFKLNDKFLQDLIDIRGEVRCKLTFGKGLCFHSNLIHKSGSNLSKSTRLTIQSRWFDASMNDAIENNYIGGIDEGNDPFDYLLD
mgnify:CR=1 FL=1